MPTNTEKRAGILVLSFENSASDPKVKVPIVYLKRKPDEAPAEGENPKHRLYLIPASIIIKPGENPLVSLANEVSSKFGLTGITLMGMLLANDPDKQIHYNDDNMIMYRLIVDAGIMDAIHPINPEDPDRFIRINAADVAKIVAFHDKLGDKTHNEESILVPPETKAAITAIFREFAPK